MLHATCMWKRNVPFQLHGHVNEGVPALNLEDLLHMHVACSNTKHTYAVVQNLERACPECSTMTQ